MAAELANRLDLVHIELDAIFHQAGWEALDDDEFLRRVDVATDVDGWTLCGGYGQIHELRAAKADTLVWLDYPRPLVTSRVIRRTIRRAITREELWNGNREPLSNFTSWDPEKNVIRWSWVHFHAKREKYAQACDDGIWSHLDVHRFRSPAEADRWLRAIR